MNEFSALSTNLFYGERQKKLQASNEQNKKMKNCAIPYIPRDLLHGPNILWRVFQKQDEALEFMKYCKDGLMCFAFEHFDPGRLFLVAHPKVFWHYDVQRDSDSRCTYEIITEYTACKIYVDLEYDITLNQNCNGIKMVDIFVNLLCFYFQKIWGTVINRKDILNLDSTTSSKFSRHLIFNLPTCCFSNNYQVGYFIKYVCQNVRDIFQSGELPEIMINKFSLIDFKNLMVIDAKGNTKIFCDEGVYTKNRHFRLYGSTKKGKHSNLLLSKDNEFSARSDLHLFLYSIITYINVPDIKVLEYNDFYIKNKGFSKQTVLKKEATPSPYPFIDDFISHLIVPGKIYRSVYFGTKKIIVYDVIGNRYCGNIQREHKSNNVKYIVDLCSCMYYQKCYDYDCSAYRSEKVSLPCEIAFKLTDNSDIYRDDNNQGVFGLSPSEAEQVLDAIEVAGNLSSSEDKAPNKKFQKFPSFGLKDEEFFKIDC